MSLGNYMMNIDQLVKGSQKIRDKSLLPLWKFLTFLRVTPNAITFARFLIGGVSFYFLYPLYPKLALSLVILSAMLDFLDGGLARYQKIASDRGKFWDVLVDHFNYVFPIYTFLVFESFSTAILSYQLLITPIVFLLATIADSEERKTDWIIHPYYKTIYFKIFGLLALVLYVYFSIDSVDIILLALNIAMTIWSLYYVWVLLKRWEQPYDASNK